MKVVITLEDTPDGRTDIGFKFDPPYTKDIDVTPALYAATEIMELLKRIGDDIREVVG